VLLNCIKNTIKECDLYQTDAIRDILGKGYTGKQRRVLQRKLSYGEEDLFVFGGPTMCFAEELAKCHSSGKADRYSLGIISGLLGMVLTATT